MKKVLAGGVFNIIHPGHIYFLKEAKKLGSYLIVVVASDRTAGKKAIFPAEVRKKMVESLKFVDRVVIGSETDRMNILEKEKPDIVVLGYDQEMQIPDFQVKRIRKLKGFSTKKIIKKIKNKKISYSSSSSGHCSSSSS